MISFLVFPFLPLRFASGSATVVSAFADTDLTASAESVVADTDSAESVLSVAVRGAEEPVLTAASAGCFPGAEQTVPGAVHAVRFVVLAAVA